MPTTEPRPALREWHLISCEYPPQIGGVCDYTFAVAAGLGAAHQSVHVWCPPAAGERRELPNVTVHPELGGVTPGDLAHTGRLLDRFDPPRHLLVQWVPHGYRYRSMNLPFCGWLWSRARQGDAVDVMVHEPFLAFEGSPRQYAAASVHRMMSAVLLRAARRAWFSIPAWLEAWRPYALGRRIPFAWLPIPSPVVPVHDPRGVANIAERYTRDAVLLVGHFSAHGPLVRSRSKTVVRHLLERATDTAVLLIGSGSHAVRDEILSGHQHLSTRVHSTGPLDTEDVSRHLQACRLLVQPYPDGVSSRRTTVMAALAHGKAVVTTSGSHTESLWRETGAVRLVPADDAEAMVREVQHLLHDESELDQLGRCGLALYDERFDVRHTIDALLASWPPS